MLREVRGRTEVKQGVRNKAGEFRKQMSEVKNTSHGVRRTGGIPEQHFEQAQGIYQSYLLSGNLVSNELSDDTWQLV